MAFFEVDSIYTLLQDVYVELNTLTCNNFSRECALLVHNLYDCSLRFLVTLILKLRKINTQDVTHAVRNHYYKCIVKLIASINNIDDADSHAIGQELSTDMYANIAQDILNVKRFREKCSTTRLTYAIDSLEYFFEQTFNVKYGRTLPKINETIIHTKTQNLNWFRIKLTSADPVEIRLLFLEFATAEDFTVGLHSLYMLAPDIFEFYYSDQRLFSLMTFFENCEAVASVIFYSNLKHFKLKSSCSFLTLSNIVKFYYCSITKLNDFIITSTENMRIFNRTFLYAILFLKKNNMHVSNDSFNSSPMSRLSGNNPNNVVRNLTRIVEEQTSYEESLLKLNPQCDLRNTAMTEASIADGNKRHVVFGIDQDRDNRIVAGQSLIGSNNFHEVILYKF